MDLTNAAPEIPRLLIEHRDRIVNRYQIVRDVLDYKGPPARAAST